MPDSGKTQSNRELGRRRVLGGYELSLLGAGTAKMAGRPGVWGEPEDRAECVATLRAAVDRGITFIDTSDAYGPYVAEEIVREALHPYPSHVLIGTKIGDIRPGPGAGFYPMSHPQYLRHACHASMRRLGLDQLPLVHLHRPDPRGSFEDQVGTLAELRKEGKIANIGLSNITPAQFDQGRAIVEIASVQNLYNLVERTAEDEAVLKRCEALDLTFFPFFPLASGKLTGPDAPQSGLAARLGVTPAQLALAWLLHYSPVMVPIPGAITLAELEDDIGAAEIAIAPDALRELNAIGAS